MSDAKPTVLLFTETFPFPGGERSFLPPEVEALSARTSVVIIPGTRPGGEPAVVPAGTVVDTALAEWNARRGPWLRAVAGALVSPRVYAEVARQAPLGLRPKGIATIVLRDARASRTRRWVRTSRRAGRTGQPVVAYSWWSSTTALGVARALSGSSVPVVSRAHGYDLFAEQEAIGFVPFQAELLRRSTAVRSVSEAGTERLRSRHPQDAARVATARLGVLEPAGLNPGADAPPFHLVSCSTLVPVKRIELIAEAVGVLRRREPELDVHWTHIGSGPGMAALESRLAADPEARRCTTLLGQLPPAAVLAWYEQNPVDVVINVSSSEGVPVSLMEAASMGIPLMATDVGGSSEIVGPDSGILLPAHPTAVEVADALASLARATPERRDALRQGARRTWQARYSAERNYSEFADWLVSLAVH